MKKTGFLFDKIYLKHETPDFHPEHDGRLRAIMAAMQGSGIWDDLMHIPPIKASFEDVGMVHTQGHIERLKALGHGYLDPDTYMSEHSLEAALCAVGAIMAALDAAKAGEIERAFCAVRPPGHHAEADRAMGFCLFNNVAVGARHAQRIGYNRVFIIDFDVHHGNGTQHVFEEDDTVFYLSTHQYPHYPGTGGKEETGIGKGKGFTLNIPMPSGSGDEQYRKAYAEILPPVMGDFKPDIVLVSAGYDIRLEDPLAGVRVTRDGLRDIVRGILSACPREAPCIFTLEGGYDLPALAESVLTTVQEAMQN